jgi:nucleoside phosphorylase
MSRPDWLHYKSRYGIHEILCNHQDEDRAQDFLFKGLEYGCNPNLGKLYNPNIMILDTFLSDRSDRALFQKIRNHQNEFPHIHILMANPYGYFANHRHEKIGSETHDSPITKTIAGLRNIIQGLDNTPRGNGKDSRLSAESRPPEQICIDFIQDIQRRYSQNIQLKFYDEYPSSPMYFFNDILMLGRFGAGRNCMDMAWYMFVDEQSCENDLFDENTREFKYIWDNAKDYPEHPEKVLINGAYVDVKDRQFDVAIICALQIELDAVIKMGLQTSKKAWDWQEFSVEDDNNIYHKTVITISSGKNISIVAATLNQMGSVASSCLTTTIISNFHPKAVILVGIAAGTSSPGRNIGDILVAHPVVDYSSGKLSLDEDGTDIFFPDPHPISIHEKLLGLLNFLNGKKSYLNLIRENWSHPQDTILKLHIGPLATGEQVVANSQPINNIKKHWRKLIGIEMEAYGVYFAASKTVNPAPYFWCFKSVSDFADGNKSDDFQPYAAYTAAEYCNHFLINHYESLVS